VFLVTWAGFLRRQIASITLNGEVLDRSDLTARQLAAIVASSDDAIVSKDLDGIVLSWNAAAERIFGFTAAEMVGQSIRRIIPDDRQSEEDDVLAAIRAGRRVDHFETLRKTRDGRLIPISLTVSPVLDADGRVVGASKIARDISERKRAEAQAARIARREAFLAQVTLTLTGSLDYEHTLRTLATAAIPALGDYCAVDVIDEDGGLVRVAAAQVDPDHAQLAHDLRAQFEDPQSPASPHGVVQTGMAWFVPEVSDQMLVDAAQGNSTGLEMLRALGIVSYLCVPIALHDRVFGALTLASARSGRVLTQEDLRLVQDVAARAALCIENARSYRQLQHANRVKDEFLATLSHELRTPLNAVLGYARMLQSGAIAPEKVPQALEVIDRNASSLAQIVEDVLDVSRIILGKARLRVEPTDLSALVHDAIATVAPAIDAKGLQLRRTMPRQVSEVMADPTRLQQVIWNLLSNAVKFTPRGGRIDVRIIENEGHIEIVVADTGIGFSAAFKGHLFERFRQADSGTTRPHGGLGLGLAIARHIVEMHGGTIEADSPGEGQGATFTVKLPMTNVAAGAGSTSYRRPSGAP
jgi:PAS domain S-box-containing protein